MFNEGNVVEMIKKGRLRWAGHAMRSQNSTKNSFETKSGRKNASGKTKIEVG